MGIFNRKEKRQLEYLTNTFKMFTGYSPIYTSYDGGLYEMSLTRSCIDKIATQCSKLNAVLIGNKNYRKVANILRDRPNSIMTPQQFLYRLTTILLVENNAYIVPIYANKLAKEIVGFYPVRADNSKITTYNGTEYLTYKINEEKYSIEYNRVGHLRRFYYKKEYYGSNNDSLRSTMDLIDTQEKGIKEGIKSGAMIRFLAKLGVVQKPSDIIAEQKRLKEDQLSMDNNGGILIFDSKYTDIKQVDSKPFIVDENQMNLIKKNVFDYFHMSEEILQNTASEDQWNMFYEDVIEPIAIQISQVLTNMLITKTDRDRGMQVILESTKLQFVSNNTKLLVSQQLFDRGILSTNQVCDIWNLPHVEGGDSRFIRKEYANVEELNKPIDEVMEDINGSGNNQSEEGNEESNNQENKD